nr:MULTISPECIES: hypothetical protein [Bacteroides]
MHQRSAEHRILRVAVVAVLPDSVGVVLACAFVFQFGGDNRKTVEQYAEVKFIPFVGFVEGITHLAYHGEAVGEIKLVQGGIYAGECRFGLHQFDGNSLYLQALPQNIHQRMTVVEFRVVVLDYSIESRVARLEAFDKAVPGVGLGVEELPEHIRVNPSPDVEITGSPLYI